MIFNSFSFLFIFFPLFFLAYLYAPREWGKYIILAGSVIFYLVGTWRNPYHLALLFGMTLIGQIACELFQQDRYAKKWILTVVLVLLCAPLAYVKLAGLFLKDAPSLPLGLSFYTFQLIAFVVYAYRGGQTDALEVFEGTVFFPKLISGPIAKPEDLFEDIEAPMRKRSWIDAGLQDFVIGLAYKVVIADHLGGVLGKIRTWGVTGVSVPLAWIGVLGYALQLYFDFWGYSRMALGLGKMLGFLLPENFDHPYCSVSVREFWRRWHITLGEWFKNHVYIPLGGSRNGTRRMVIATLVVWLLTGIWHGAGWNYVVWGLVMFGLIMGERFFYGSFMEEHPFIGHIYLPIVIGLSWIFFITGNLSEALAYFGRLVGITKATFDANDWKTILSWAWPYLAGGIVLATPYPQMLWKKVHKTLPAWIFLFVLFLVCVYFIATAASDPFLYFSF